VSDQNPTHARDVVSRLYDERQDKRSRGEGRARKGDGNRGIAGLDWQVVAGQPPIVIVNSYDQRRGDIRPAQKPDWDGIMAALGLIIAGDMKL
jgi:hypothetical protein